MNLAVVTIFLLVLFGILMWDINDDNNRGGFA